MAQKRTFTEAAIIPVRSRNQQPKRNRVTPTTEAASDSSEASAVSQTSALQSTPGVSDDSKQASLSPISSQDDGASESDASDISSDESSSEEEDDEEFEEEEDEEEEVVTLGGPKRPEIDPKRVLEEARKLQDRLQELLPKLRQANNLLGETGGSQNIEDVGEGEEHIEMNLGLGVLEEQNDSDDEDALNESQAKETFEGKEGAGGQPETQSDVMQTLLGTDKEHVRPGIEEV